MTRRCRAFRPSRRELLALGLGRGRAAWSDRGSAGAGGAAASPPSKPTGQAVIGISQEPTVFNPLMLHIEVDEGVYFNSSARSGASPPTAACVPDLAAEVPSVDERRHLRRTA